jgi:transcriptional antiterminator NusG
MNNWSVIFVKTGMEDKIIEKLKSSIDVSLAMPFTITRERYVRKAGVFSVERNMCFHSYIFIQTDLLAEDLLVLMREGVRRTKDIYRFLTYDGKNDIFIRNRELSPLVVLCGRTTCIEKSSGIIVGDAVMISSGPLVGMEGFIKRIDKYRHRATLDLYIMEGIRPVTVALEIVGRR